VRRVVEQLDLGFVAAAEERFSGALREAGGITAATVVLPPRTSSRASSRARLFTSSAASAASAAITLRDTSLLSRLTTATAIFDGGRSCVTPPKMYPKNDAITMGADEAHRHRALVLKNRRRSRRTKA
jgi:hypothetical protein